MFFTRQETLTEQRDVEDTFSKRYHHHDNQQSSTPSSIEPLHVLRHYNYLVGKLQRGSSHHLDSSRPWLVYWPLHALDLLRMVPRALKHEVNAKDLFDWLFTCWTYVEPRRGGFTGGPFQAPHLASCWAACGALVILASETPSLRPLLKERLDTEALTNWLIGLRVSDGGFKMFDNGEIDLRATYCAACIATVFDLDASRIFPEDCLYYVGQCQSLDGGISSNIHGSEGHGGYVSCGFKGLVLMHALRESQKRRRQSINEQESCLAAFSVRKFIDCDQLRRWCALRQDPCSGGFNGRVNKLVDSCYAWWIGGALAVLGVLDAVEILGKQQQQQQQEQRNSEEDPSMQAIMNARALVLIQRAKLLPKNVVAALATKTVTNQQEQQQNANARSNNDDDDEQHHQHQQAAQPTSSWVDADEDAFDDGGDFAFHQDRLAEYVLELCQTARGGLCDKPNLNPDLYHSCYSLSGLSTAVVSDVDVLVKEILASFDGATNAKAASDSAAVALDDDGMEEEDDDAACSSSTTPNSIQDKFATLCRDAYQFQHFNATDSVDGKMQATHPLLNLTLKRVDFALSFFGGRESLL